MATEQRPPSRIERRERTQHRILAAARRQFAESGYDRTTIRSIATEAETDPGLIMRYFGSKEALFNEVATIASDEPLGETPEQVAESLLDSLAGKLATDSAGTLAMLRSMLTRPEAAEEVRAAISEQQRLAADALDGTDAGLRIGLIGAISLGTIIGRELLGLDGVAEAEPAELINVLRPAVHALTYGEPMPPPTAQPQDP
ncbi:TetR family transcriptional regulator [Tamaricihabitans halophyticus]|uniref:TetR family transcriptional regulator n=1 Tax=Tamaricihabitans halophyticus TaxID=1262583 RepID=A0A4R2R2B8_9PSEU|nr:TetR/AcrR family transcriptional regulator [Tamaricihabitans halophyticus]TCP56167.1 TetR family transcriptional regulator [Tamaricihabitans halophyticus]